MSPVTESVIGLLERHGSLVVLAVSLLENLGLPIPALPILVVAGALVVGGPVSLPLTLAAAAVGSLAADLLWFEIGRRKGRAALHVFCKLSLNPDACVGRAERLFRARTTTTILSSKLVPGLNTLVPPLAGVLGLGFWRYLLLDTAASLLWAGLGVGLGVAFGAGILGHIQSMQRGLLTLLAVLVALYAVGKLLYRRYLVRHYSVPRIDPGELNAKLSSADGVLVVDLRNEEAFRRSETALPGAIRIPPGEFKLHLGKLDPGKEVILYCS
ncbi:MAG: hypothetical protein DMG07_09425 [Acidobacteria bacterium]|nr:MAG: hypothetical protein DMG07_09425 [Acidobacteriota bacterium]